MLTTNLRYALVKILSITLGVCFTPLSVYVGVLFGQDRAIEAWRYVLLMAFLAGVDGISFWWLVEANKG